MKKITYLLLIALVICPALKAQKKLFLEEQEVQIDDGSQHAWVMPTVGDLDEVLKDLDDFSKERSDVKMKKGGENLLIAEKVSLLSVVAKRGDLIGYAYNTNNENVIALVFRLGYDISLNSEEWYSEMRSFRDYSKEFMTYHYEQAYARRLDDLDKDMKDLEKDRGKAEKQIGNMNDQIEKNNKKIEKETDVSKIADSRGENTSLSSDIENLSGTIPQHTSNLEQLQTLKDQLSTEAYSYLETIKSL